MNAGGGPGRQVSIPFLDRYVGAPAAAFAGRRGLRKDFASLTWDRQAGVPRTSFAWLVQGGRTMGKTSFLNYCVETARDRREQGKAHTIVVGYNFVTDPTSRREFWKSNDAFFDALYGLVLSLLRPYARAARWRHVVYRLGGAWRALESAEAFGVKLPHWPFGCASQTRFVTVLGKLLRDTDPRLSAVVFLLDEIGQEDPQGRPVDRSVEYATDLLNAVMTHTWEETTANVGVVLLPLPSWEDHCNDTTTPRRNLSRGIEYLAPFDETETKELIGNELSRVVPEWTCEREYPSYLYAMSGGFPRLVQKMGRLSAELCGQRGGGRELRVEHVKGIINDKRLEEDLVFCAYDHGASPFASAESLRVLELFGERRLIGDDVARKGLPKKEWRDRIVGEASGDRAARREAFERVWDHLEQRGLLGERSIGEYRFTALAVRQHLQTIADRFRGKH